jgi:tripartite-type tricarboxylate transporter receptor subunit TctC
MFRALGVCVGLMAAATPACAQRPYPERPIRIVNPSMAGSATDTLARALAEGLSSRLGQPVSVVNRPGAGGAIGTAEVAHAMPDGYTLYFGAIYVLSVLPAMRTVDARYTPDALTPICQTVSNAMVLAVRADSPFTSVRELVDAARDAPGTLKYAHQGEGTVPNLAMEELLETAKLRVAGQVARSDGGALSELMSGSVDVAALVQNTAAHQNLRILGIFADERHPSFPDIPTVKEQGFDVSTNSVGGLMAPAATPRDIVSKLAAACEYTAKDAPYQETARRVGQPLNYYGNIATFRHRLNRDIDLKRRLLGRMNLAK